MEPIQSDIFNTLLSVFYVGLRNGIISKQEVVDWADAMINQTDEPEYFLIEISLSNDVNDLISLIDKRRAVSPGKLVHRVIFGVVYNKLLSGEIDIKKASAIFSDNMYRYFSPGAYEQGRLYQLEDDFDSIGMNEGNLYSDTEMTNMVLEFLQTYKAFNLTNYAEWEQINVAVEASVAPKDALREAEIKIWQEEYAAKEITRKIKLKRKKNLIKIAFASSIVLAIIDVIVNLKISSARQPLTKFWSDLYQLCRLYVFFMVCYGIVKEIEFLLRRVVKLFR